MKNADMPAMPFPEYDGNGAVYYTHPGLTKREQLAAMAMQGLLAGEYRDARQEQYEHVARHAKGHADALLAALDASRPVEPKP